MTNFNQMVLAQEDPFEYIYEGISGIHGIELRDYLTEMYSLVSIDECLHPDDDFTDIIWVMVDLMENEA